jgi:DNA-binding GntR family transcriptional regulator
MNIQEYIENDLEQKVLSGINIPEKLTLEFLSKHYKVSTRPVRLALQKLLEKKILLKQDNARILPNPKKISTKKKLSVVAPPTNYYEIVLNDLVKMSLLGSEKEIYLREEELAEKYGLSRTPVRNILHTIARTGLVEHQQRIGWVLVPFSLNDYEQFKNVRALMEVYALEVSCQQLDPKKIEIYLEGNYIDEEGIYQLDNDFHQYIIDSSQNRYVKDFFKRYQPFFQLFIIKEKDSPTEAKLAWEFHQEILKNILKKNWKAAKESLKGHILSSKTYKNSGVIIQEMGNTK